LPQTRLTKLNITSKDKSIVYYYIQKLSFYFSNCYYLEVALRRLSYRRSPVEGLVDVWRHGVDFRIQLLLYLDHVFLVPLGDEVDGQPDLPEPTRPADSVQVDAAFVGEVEVEDHVDGLHIDASGDQIGADQCFELSLSEPVKNLYPFIRLHIGMKILILIFLLIELLRQILGSSIRPAKDDALVDDQTAVYLENSS